jgi:hypothetical protein
MLVGFVLVAFMFAAVGTYFVAIRRLSKYIEAMTPDQRVEFFKTRRQRYLSSNIKNKSK